MDIRPDFRAAEPLLQRLAGIGTQFARYNNEDWSHLKNREDFQRVYLLPQAQRSQLEELYAKGRDCAIFMSSRLREFNDVGEFPTFADYVDSFSRTWTYEHEELQGFIDGIKELTGKLEQTPWAVGRMVVLFEDQLRLLAGVRHTIALLKQSHTYLVDKGEAPMEKPRSISIGTVTGKVNINSTDNSTNYTFNSSPVFAELAAAVFGSAIEQREKAQLLDRIDAMKQAEGSSGYIQKYKDFIQNAANHMSVVSPFLPALAGLLT
jgi:hypothetical protein